MLPPTIILKILYGISTSMKQSCGVVVGKAAT